MALVNPNIAMSYKPTTEYQPRNVLAEYAQLQQIQGGQMQMAKLKRDEEALDTMMQTITANGGPEDPMVAADAMIKSRNPDFMAAGLAIQQKHRDTQQTRAALGLPPLRGTGAPTATSTNALAPTPPISGALGSGTFDPTAPAAPTNAMVPAAAPAAPTNAMAAGGMSPEVMRAYEMLASPSPAVQKAGEIILKDLKESQVVPSGGTVFQGGKPIYTAPKERTSTLRTPQELEQEIQINAARRSINPPAVQPPVAVVGPNGKPMFVSREQAIREGMTPAPTSGDKDATVSEQQAAYNLGRVLAAAGEVAKIAKNDPSALQPGVMEALPGSVGMTGTANLARNANRQIVDGAQRDALDALLVLATGAAYNKEQLEGQTRAYIPSFTDKAETIKAKQQRMANLIQSAKIRAGKAWTSEMETASQVLINPTAASKPPAAPSVSGNVVVTPDGQSHSFPTPAAAAQFKKAVGL